MFLDEKGYAIAEDAAGAVFLRHECIGWLVRSTTTEYNSAAGADAQSSVSVSVSEHDYGGNGSRGGLMKLVSPRYGGSRSRSRCCRGADRKCRCETTTATKRSGGTLLSPGGHHDIILDTERTSQDARWTFHGASSRPQILH
jgi:hypothetical protein